MSGQQRNRLQVDERRAQLVALALEIFGQRAYDEISIDEIARAAGISKGLLYHYFPSKREYYVAALREAAEQLRAETAIEPASAEPGTQSDALPGALPGIGQLRASLDAYLAFVDQRAPAYGFLMRGGLGTDPEVRAVVEETRAHFTERMLTALGRSASDARLRTALRGWIAFVEAASLDWIEHRDLDRAALADLLAHACMAIITMALAQPAAMPLASAAEVARPAPARARRAAAGRSTARRSSRP